MSCAFSLLIFLCPVFLTNSLHFLGGFFSYQHVDYMLNDDTIKVLLVEIRFHISDHFFRCTPDQINKNLIVYLIDEQVPYDNQTMAYRWNDTKAVRANQRYFDIKCFNQRRQGLCENVHQQMWGYCASVNGISGYSTMARRFLVVASQLDSLQLHYSACCWTNTPNKTFHFQLITGSPVNRSNSSPYPLIPASYYVPWKRRQTIAVFAFDADGDDMICEAYRDDALASLTVHVDEQCQLHYHDDRVGKQFGHFWLLDKSENQILSRTLISVQVEVLGNVICDHQPDLLIVDKENNTVTADVKLLEPIDLWVSVDPHTRLVHPDEQTITELSTMCSNYLPKTLENGGIQVQFRCQFHHCQGYPICFVGEFSSKLPSTHVECFLIEVKDTGECGDPLCSLEQRSMTVFISAEENCVTAAKKYGYSGPELRHFVLPPRRVALEETTTPSKPTRSSRLWLWILIPMIALLLVALVACYACKRVFSFCIQHFDHEEQSRFIPSSPIATTHHSMPGVVPCNSEFNEPLMPSPVPDSAKRMKTRTHQLRLGSIDYPERH